jgi:hypothetical protein
MTTECDICNNHTLHIYTYNLNTLSSKILQINPHTVDKIQYLFITYEDKSFTDMSYV